MATDAVERGEAITLSSGSLFDAAHAQSAMILATGANLASPVKRELEQMRNPKEVSY